MKSLNFQFSYFQRNYTSLTINTNGYITFRLYPLSYTIDPNRPTLSDTIAPYNFYFNSLRSGNIFYRITTEYSDLLFIESEINQLLNLQASFKASQAFILTFDRIMTKNNKIFKAMSFQTILSSNKNCNESYLTINYNSCVTNDTDNINLPYSGFDCVNSTNQLIENLIINPCNSSNVGITGKWIFYVNTECNK